MKGTESLYLSAHVPIRGRLPGMDMLQSYAFRKIIRLERELVDEISYFTIDQAERRLEELETLIAENFGEDWNRIQKEHGLQATQAEVEELLAV